MAMQDHAKANHDLGKNAKINHVLAMDLGKDTMASNTGF